VLGGPRSSQTLNGGSQIAVVQSRIFAGPAHRRNAGLAVTARDA
jgi:hypothetical protein